MDKAERIRTWKVPSDAKYAPLNESSQNEPVTECVMAVSTERSKSFDSDMMS